MSNLLENALEAAKRTPDGQRKYIDLVMRRHELQFGIMVENSFDGDYYPNWDDKKFCAYVVMNLKEDF